jgi:hypothetical protein
MNYLKGTLWPIWRYYTVLCRSQWPRRLKHWSVAARLLGLRFPIPPEARMSLVRTVCCDVEVVQRSPTECAVWVWSRSRDKRRPWPTRALEPWGGGKPFISRQWGSIRKSSLRIAANLADIRAKYWYKLLLNRNRFYPQPSKLIIYIILPLGIIPVTSVVKGVCSLN